MARTKKRTTELTAVLESTDRVRQSPLDRLPLVRFTDRGYIAELVLFVSDVASFVIGPRPTADGS